MELNEDASNVSQGQKQLLTIARAILADTDMRSSIARPDSHPAGHEPIGK